MLSISKPLSSSQVKTYYSKEYVSAQNNYWQRDQTAPGQWTGNLAKSMGLTGPIDFNAFAQLSDGKNPFTDEQIIRHIDRQGYTKSDGTVVKPVEHRAGWDATFSAPKSVSLTALVGGDSRILEAHTKAVDVALSHLETFIQARVSSDREETTAKMLAAKFEHQTARPVDGYAAPQLHTHVVIFNMTQRADGTFNSLQPKSLFESQQYATAIYQSELTYQLQSLGYELEAGKSGAPEIRGYSQKYLDASSPRRAQIDSYLKENGQRSAEAAEIAAHSTRDNKQVMSQEEIQEAHRKLADQYGNQADHVVAQAALNQTKSIGDNKHEKPSEAYTAQTALTYAKETNFEREAVVDERHIIRDALRRGMGSTRIDAVEAALNSRTATGEFQTVSRESPSNNPARRLTSWEVIYSERFVIQEMQIGQNTLAPIMSAKDAKAQSKTRDFLNPAQQRTITEVLTTQDKIHGLQGLAGTGKTTALESIREGAEKSGYVVQGFAPTSRAAQQLRDAKISADTIQGFLTKGGQADNTPHLYMLDESSLASTTQMRDFFKRLGAEDRVLLIGDTRQHQGVDAGKPFQQLQEAGMRTSLLDQIMRQKDPELREAVEHLSRNETTTGVTMLQKQGRIHEIKEPTERVTTIAERYVEHPESTIIVSPDNASRRSLNLAVREKLQSLGTVSQKNHSITVLMNRSDITGADRTWAARYEVGDIIEYQKGSRKYGLEKHSSVRVMDVDVTANTLTVQKNDGQQVTYNPENVKGVNIYKEVERQFATGDRLQFTSSNKKLGIANRDLGTIEKIDLTKSEMTVKMDNKPSITFDPSTMRNFDHGYAVTSHSSQGLTTDRALINMDTSVNPKLINTRFAYVSVSRARTDVQIFTNDTATLGKRLNTDISKESAIDASLLNKQTPTQAKAQEHDTAQRPSQANGHTAQKHEPEQTRDQGGSRHDAAQKPSHATDRTAQKHEPAQTRQHGGDHQSIAHKSGPQNHHNGFSETHRPTHQHNPAQTNGVAPTNHTTSQNTNQQSLNKEVTSNEISFSR